MAWHSDDNGDLVWDSAEKGIAPSPLKGTANIQNANISTETGEVMASFGRINQSQQAITGGTLTASSGAGTTLLGGPSTLLAGSWVDITSTSITIIATTAPVSYLAVGGGGAGGARGGTAGVGGGGGAGQMATSSASLAVGAYAITIGAGGVAGAASGANGSSTIIASVVTAIGGGGGGQGAASGGSASNGANGGSGGGGGGSKNSSNTTGGTGSAGNNGGGGITETGNPGSGGGGGAGAVGTGAADIGGGNANGGNGGNGTASSISGASVTYAGGGAGLGNSNGSAGTGGGGGQNAAGTANTGGGAGGSSGATGFAGGTGIAIISYPTGSLTATGGSITTSGGNTIHTFTTSGTFTVTGVFVSIPLPTGNYYISYSNTSNQFKISSNYDPYGLHPIVHGTTGTATFNVLTTIGSPIAKATENFNTATGNENRYYVLDVNGYVWVYDTAVYASTLAASGVGTLWMLPDPTNYSSNLFTGIGIINGWLMAISSINILTKSTVNLGIAFSSSITSLMNPFHNHINFAYTGHQGKMFYTDGNYIGEIFPTTSFITSIANIQSFASYTAVTTTGTATDVFSGSMPTDSSSNAVRIPAVFFTDQYGTRPTNLTADTVYYIETSPGNFLFSVYAALTGGSPIDIAAGASGNQYFNTFYPIGSDAGANGTHATVQITQQRLNLPAFEIAQCIVELDNTIIIGCIGNTLYPWNQIDPTPSGLITLPEGNVTSMINVNNIGYVFAGNKGNIYITNNSVASLVTKVPDYCAGIAGSPSTYVEPYFTWGDSDYIRGRVYFSILDQTAAKTGNCGGIWSFVPSQNVDVNQDIGIALRLENQSSYNTYNGLATVIIGNQKQLATAPQYWTGWYSSISAPTYGIDATAAFPTAPVVIETDLVAAGTLLNKKTLSQIEYKLSTPLANGESVQIYGRSNATDAYTSLGNVILETSNPLSGYFEPTFQTSQWLQFKLVLTPLFSTSTSFVRLTEMRIR